jgi:ankyrin repeat protein
MRDITTKWKNRSKEVLMSMPSQKEVIALASTAPHWKVHEAIVRLLVNNGARSNQPGYQNSACLPLHTAELLRHVKIVKALLGNGANVAVQGGAYRFTLTAAAAGGSTRIVWLLLEKGAKG